MKRTTQEKVLWAAGRAERKSNRSRKCPRAGKAAITDAGDHLVNIPVVYEDEWLLVWIKPSGF